MISGIFSSLIEKLDMLVTDIDQKTVMFIVTWTKAVTHRSSLFVTAFSVNWVLLMMYNQSQCRIIILLIVYVMGISIV